MEVYNTNIKKKNNIELNQDMAQNDDSKDRLVKKFDIIENNKINMQIPMDDEFIIGTLNQEENGEKIDNNDEIEREIKPSFKTPKPPPRRIRGANKKKSIEVTNIDQYQEWIINIFKYEIDIYQTLERKFVYGYLNIVILKM